jgi:hypothetical protein
MRTLEQELAVPGKFDAAAAPAMEKRRTEQRLEPLHLHGNRRLRPPDELRRAGKTALLRDKGEDAKEVGIYGGRTAHKDQNA